MKLIKKFCFLCVLCAVGFNASAQPSVPPQINKLLAPTNLYSAHEVEVMAGLADSYADVHAKLAGYGLVIGGTYWNTLHTGTGLRAGVDDIRSMNAYLFDYTQVDYSVRFFWSRLAYGGRMALGKSFKDGSSYTEPDFTLEYRFTPKFGVEGDGGYKFTTTKGAGLRFDIAAVWSFGGFNQ